MPVQKCPAQSLLVFPRRADENRRRATNNPVGWLPLAREAPDSRTGFSGRGPGHIASPQPRERCVMYETVYLTCALAGGTLLVCQVVLGLLGFGDHHDVGTDHDFHVEAG